MRFLLCRYALDVNVERAEDVLTHKRLLQLAKDPANRPAFEVRIVQVNTPVFISLLHTDILFEILLLYAGLSR